MRVSPAKEPSLFILGPKQPVGAPGTDGRTVAVRLLDFFFIRLLQEVANPSTVLSGSVVPLLSELHCGLCKGLGCEHHSAERLPGKHGRALCPESSKKRLPLLIHS